MNKKYLPFVIGAVVIILGLASVFVLSSRKAQNGAQAGSNLPTSEIIPTVDSSVKVALKAGPSGKGYVQLTVDGIPSGTDTIEYEMSYNTAEQGLQGIVNEPVAVKGSSTSILFNHFINKFC